MLNEKELAKQISYLHEQIERTSKQSAIIQNMMMGDEISDRDAKFILDAMQQEVNDYRQRLDVYENMWQNIMPTTPV